jgi:maleamate amidohydrolase
MQRGEASAFDPAFYCAAIGGVRRPSEGTPFWRSPSGAQVAEAVSVRPVLLVIDILVDFLDRWSEADRAKLVASVRSVVELFRAMGLPVVWVRQEFEPDLSDAFLEMRRENISITIKGTPGCRIIPELVPLADETQIIKKRFSAFFGTPLDRLLVTLGADTVVLAGVNTHACVRMAAIDAYQRDLDVIIAREAVGSYDREHERVSLRYMDGGIARVMSLSEVAACLAGRKAQS